MEMLQSFKRCMMSTVPLMVIKYNKLAAVDETLESKLAADMYISASLEQDSFLTYKKFSVSSLQKAGFSLADAQLMSIDKYRIPMDRRELVMKYEREKVLSEYNEQNNYYRLLNGLPDKDDTDCIYVPEEYCIKYDIDNTTPLHKISRTLLSVLEIEGVLLDLYNKYKKEYIKYLGDRNIDIVTARLADNFSLLYFPKNGIDIFYRDFIITYDQCREYFLTVIYNRHLSTMHDRYDDFIGFTILTMTVQRLITTIFKVIVDRDFYDVDTIRLFLESYNVPFIKSFPMTQLKLLSHNLNKLIANKSNNVVLFDIINILGYDNFEIMKCYLFKQHKLDDDTGNPIFKYKIETDENGVDHIVEDKAEMYDLFFKSINVLEEDVQSALESAVDTEEYDRFIVGDTTWINDDELKKKIFETDFNYVDTKYMTVNIMYKMHKMLFEIVYVFKTIVDNKSQTSKIFLELPKITRQPISMFDCILTLVVLNCERQGMESSIIKDPSKILSVMGFNFDLDLEKIKQDILSNSKLDDDLCKYLTKIQFTTPNDVNNMYENIKNLEELIVIRMNETTDIHTYQLYDDLYKTLLTSKIHNELFVLPNGKVADTYLEYLEYKNPTVATYISKLKEENIGECMDYITVKIMDVLTSTQYLHYMNSLDSYMAEGILKLLRFFKSYTIDIGDLDIIYLMDSRYYNMIRIIGQFEKTITELKAVDSSINMDYNDIVNIVKNAMNNKDTMELVDFMINNYRQVVSDIVETKERLNTTQDVLVSSQIISSFYADYFRLSEIIKGIDHSINTIDRVDNCSKTIQDKSDVISTHKLDNITQEISVSSQVLSPGYSDYIKLIDTNINVTDTSINTYDKVDNSSLVITNKSDVSITDNISTTTNVLHLNDVIPTYDLFNLEEYPMFTKSLNKKQLNSFNNLIKSGQSKIDISDLYILLHNTLTDIMDTSHIDTLKPLIYRLNDNLKTLNQLSLNDDTNRYDKVIMHKVILFLNKLIHIISNINLTKVMDINQLRHDTIYSDEYNSIYEDIKQCSTTSRDLVYNILNLFISILETIPNKLTISQLLIILGSITRDVSSITNISLKVDLEDSMYFQNKLKYIYSDLNYLINTIGQHKLIPMIDHYLSIQDDKTKIMKIKYNDLSSIVIDKLCMFMGHNKFNMKDIIRITSCESIFHHILSHYVENDAMVTDVINIDTVIELIKSFKKTLNDSRTVLSTIYTEQEITNSFLFTTSANVILDQLEFYINNRIQQGLIQSDIVTVLELLQTCINSLVLGYTTFIDDNIEELKPILCDTGYVSRQNKLIQLKELTETLKCSINPRDEIHITESIDIIRH